MNLPQIDMEGGKVQSLSKNNIKMAQMLLDFSHKLDFSS